jgi:Rad3-related DNA helicase
MKNILDYWPFPYPPRQSQITALQWLQQQDATYLILEIPVGGGKSAIGLTYSQYMGQRHQEKRGDSYILTPQRILQEQYENSVRDIDPVFMASLYGKGNYSCHKKKTTCDIGDIVKPRCPNCPFQKAKKIAQIAPDTVLNYRLALTSFAFTKTFSKRAVMVMDECHTLEQHLVDFDAFKVMESRCKKYSLPFKTFKELNAAHEWLKDEYLPAANDVVKKLEEEAEPLFDKAGTDLTNSEIRKLREFAAFQDHVDEAAEMALTPAEALMDQFVLTWDKTMFQFKRLTGHYSFNRIVMPMADKFLFMSSTILNKEGFCEDLGIPEDKAAFLSLTSEFAPENRPVYYMPKARMNAKWKLPENKDGRETMLDSVATLCGLHQTESGIIHTGNFEIAQWLVENLKIPQKIYHHNPDSGDDRNSVITAFQGDPKPSVLISPSSTEGLDLKEDLGRFAIFVKIPFGYLGDQWIKRRMEMSSEWYQRRALIDVIQGGGRVVRSVEDWGNVYILDQSWAHLYKTAFRMIPKWWLEGYKIL